jgi:hypothetical protein
MLKGWELSLLSKSVDDILSGKLCLLGDRRSVKLTKLSKSNTYEKCVISKLVDRLNLFVGNLINSACLK